MNSMSEDEARDILGTTPTPYVLVMAEGIVIASGYSEALARLLRWVPKATWRADKRGWLVPLSGADAIRSVLPEIIRLAEAAAEESREEKTGAANAGRSFGKDWLAELSQATSRGSDELAALTQSAVPQNLDCRDIENLVAALRGEASRLMRAADRLAA